MTLRLRTFAPMAMALASAIGCHRLVSRVDSPDAVWPPGSQDCPLQAWHRGPIRPDAACVPRVLADTTFRWQHVESPHITAHYLDSTSTARDPRRSIGRAAAALVDNLALLGATEYAPHIHLFYVATREQYQRITGGPGTGFTVAWAQAVTLLAPPEETDPAERHELMHVVSMNLWGVNPLRDYWLREGLAVFATEQCNPGAIDSTARAMLADGRAKPLRTYRESFFTAGVDNYPAYMLSGSFVKFLVERGGHDRLREIWAGGVAVMPQVYGATADSLETEWKLSLAAPPHQRGGAARGCLH